jgi:two-component system NarL family sensor kinase
VTSGAAAGRMIAVPVVRLSHAAAGACVAAAGAGVALHLADAGRPGNDDFMAWWLMGAVAAVAYGVTGGYIASAPHSRTLGWLLIAIGGCEAAGLVGPQVAVHLQDDWPGLWVGNWSWRTGYALLAFAVPLVLPDGRLPSPRWRAAPWLAGAATLAASVHAALVEYTVDGPGFAVTGVRNPTGLSPVPWWLDAGALLLAVPAAAVSIAAVAARRRTAAQQLKWLALGLGGTVVLFGLGFAGGPAVTAAAMVPLPLALLAAATRFGLFGVDLALSRALRWGLVVGAGLLGYAAVADLTGSRLVAAAGVAIGAPGLDRLLRPRVNRLVHGQSDDPYAVLARIGERLEAARSAEQVLDELVRTLTTTLHIPYVAVDYDGPETPETPETPGTERIALFYAGRRVGALVVSAAAPRRLLEPLLPSAGVAVHTVALTRDLERSQQALITAREEERRALYRELHDGFGPVLAATALQAETARDLLADDPATAFRLLDEKVVPRLRGAVADVRAIVHGLRPPALDDLGLAAAVRELAAALRVEADVAEPLGAVPAAVEVAVYRIAAEALNNANRHSGAARIRLSLQRYPRRILLTVTDDGRGLPADRTDGVGLASMRARARELRGSLHIGPGPDGRGTTIAARLPLEGAQP